MKAKAMGLDESEDSEDEESEDDNKTVSQKSDHRDLSPYKSQSRKNSGSYPAKVLRLRAFFFFFFWEHGTHDMFAAIQCSC